MSKTIKQIADELGVTKQAVQKRLSREPLCSSIQPYISTVGSAKHIDENGEKLIKEAFQNSERQQNSKTDNLSMDENNMGIDKTDNLSMDGDNVYIDNSKSSIDKADNLSTDNNEMSIDNNKPSIDTDNQLSTTTDAQSIVAVLKDTIDTLQTQLNTKDTQIEHLQSELLNERQHNRELSDRLAVLADQAQKLQLAQLSIDNNNQIESKENTHKPHWWSKMKGVKNNGRKKNVCEVNN